MKRFLTGSAARRPCLAEGDQRCNKQQTFFLPESRSLWAMGFILAAVLICIGFTPAFAAEKPPTAPPIPPRIPEMSAVGKVLEVSEAVLKIERTLKGKAEMMEFILEKPFSAIAVGNQIKVSYMEKDGRNVLIRVAPAQKTAVKKAVRKDLPKEIKPVAPPVPPVTK